MDAEFRDFVEARYVELLRIAYLLTGSPHEAEDLLQSALVKVMRRWRRVDEPMAYLRRTMINQHISTWRRFRLREVVTEDPPERSTADPPTGSRSGIHCRRIAVAAAPDACGDRPALRRRSAREAEVAGLLGCSPGTVKALASRGLARLRLALDPVENWPASRPTEASDDGRRTDQHRPEGRGRNDCPAAGSLRPGYAAGGTSRRRRRTRWVWRWRRSWRE